MGAEVTMPDEYYEHLAEHAGDDPPGEFFDKGAEFLFDDPQPVVCTTWTHPAKPYEGLVIYETDTKQLKKWTGDQWEVVADGNH